ncbi:hypothetical protein [Saccharothrix sp. Mg75]|uniref:hypothetical protein n=1 Tax=Saccharothrix sp. Mg75 TaxID=3445357 RepID=UPI003EE9EDCC
MWTANEATSSQMLCSALPDQTWQRRLGAGFYRYGSDSTWCELWSADNQVAIKLDLFGAAPLGEYLTRFQADPDLAALTRQVQIAGVAAMTTGLAGGADGIGATASRSPSPRTATPNGPACC